VQAWVTQLLGTIGILIGYVLDDLSLFLLGCTVVIIGEMRRREVG